MIGPIVFGAALLYLVLSIAAVRWAIRYARKNRRSAKRWGWGAALVMYLIPFWDWLPTVAIHRYYCSTEAGFWVYKTVDQWKAENPGVADTLFANKGAPSVTQGNMENYVDTYSLNQRFNRVVKHNGPLLINRWRWEQEVVDSKTNQVLARYVDFSTGNGHIGGEPPVKFWLQGEHCIGGAVNGSRLSHFSSEVKRLGEGENK